MLLNYFHLKLNLDYSSLELFLYVYPLLIDTLFSDIKGVVRGHWTFD